MMGGVGHVPRPGSRPAKRSRHQDALVLREQLPLFEIFERDGEEVRKPLCGGCGKCAYTPLARNPRARKKKP
jgi:hypothetical protein